MLILYLPPLPGANASSAGKGYTAFDQKISTVIQSGNTCCQPQNIYKNICHFMFSRFFSSCNIIHQYIFCKYTGVQSFLSYRRALSAATDFHKSNDAKNHYFFKKIC